MGLVALDTYDAVVTAGSDETEFFKSKGDKLYLNFETLPHLIIKKFNCTDAFVWLNLGRPDGYVVKKADLPINLQL